MLTPRPMRWYKTVYSAKIAVVTIGFRNYLGDLRLPEYPSVDLEEGKKIIKVFVETILIFVKMWIN